MCISFAIVEGSTTDFDKSPHSRDFEYFRGVRSDSDTVLIVWMPIARTPVSLKPGNYRTQQPVHMVLGSRTCAVDCKFIPFQTCIFWIYLTRWARTLRQMDPWMRKKVNMVLNALSIRNVRAQIWRRMAPVKALCLRLSRDTRAVISDARETLAEAHADPRGPRSSQGTDVPPTRNSCTLPTVA